jgi:hypothetical protein
MFFKPPQPTHLSANANLRKNKDKSTRSNKEIQFKSTGLIQDFALSQGKGDKSIGCR